MARINFPLRFSDRIVLFKLVKAKHDADGASSVLIPYFIQQNIDLDADDLKADQAKDAHNLFLQNEKEGEYLSEQRNNLFNPVFKEHKNCVQFLKKLFNQNTRQLGEWGVTVNNQNRIQYHRDFLQRNQAVISFIDKHDSFTPPTSPLQPFLDANSINLAAHRADADAALGHHEEFLSVNREKEIQLEKRNLLFDPVIQKIRGIGNFLKIFLNQNPHHAGKWGFVIDSSPKAGYVRSFNLLAGQTKTVTNVILNSKLINTGSAPLFIRPAIAPHNPVISLLPKEEFTIIRRFGKISVENPLNGENGSFKAILFR